MLKSRDLAIIATLSLLTIPQIAFEAQRDLTHTVAVIFAAALFFYGFFRTLAAPSAASYLLTGVAIGIGLISKYNFALLPAAALLAVLFDREWRGRVFDWRLLLTIAASAADRRAACALARRSSRPCDRADDGKARRGTHRPVLSQIVGGFVSLALAVVSFSIVTVIVFAAVFRGRLRKALSHGNRWTALIERMMLVFLLALALLIVFGGAEHIKDRWLTPLSAGPAALPLPEGGSGRRRRCASPETLPADSPHHHARRAGHPVRPGRDGGLDRATIRS